MRSFQCFNSNSKKKKSVMNNPGFEFWCIKTTCDKTTAHSASALCFSGQQPWPPALMTTLYNPSITPCPLPSRPCVRQAQGTTCDVAGVCWVALCCFPFLHPFIHFPLSPGSFSLWGLCLHHKLIGLLSYQGGICIQTDGGTTQSQTSFS